MLSLQLDSLDLKYVFDLFLTVISFSGLGNLIRKPNAQFL